MRRYIIERDLPGVGSMSGRELTEAAIKWNKALAALGGKARWVESFVAGDKTFCFYLAEDEAAVHEHARASGFPASSVTEISRIITPMTASGR